MKCKIFKFSTLPTKEEGRSNILGMPEQDQNHKWKCLNVLAEMNIQASLRCWEEAVPGVGGVRLTTGVAVEHGSLPHLSQGQTSSVDSGEKVLTVTGRWPTDWNTGWSAAVALLSDWGCGGLSAGMKYLTPTPYWTGISPIVENSGSYRRYYRRTWGSSHFGRS